MSPSRFISSAAAIALLVGCGSSSGGSGGELSFTSAPLATLTSTKGTFTIEVRATSAVPARGDDTFDLRITDASGAGVDGLDVQVLPWMPAMGHGASITPTIVANGGGDYVLSNVDVFMPGQWELRMTFGAAATSASPAIDDDAVASFDVQ